MSNKQPIQRCKSADRYQGMYRPLCKDKFEKGDMVFVDWPNGRIGPYRVTNKTRYGLWVQIDDVFLSVPESWCKRSK